MKNSLIKDTFREIKGSLSRFLAIFAIVALGVAFFSGVKATGPNMKATGDRYFDEYRFMDIHLLSTLGFTDKDVEAVKNLQETQGVFPTYSMDGLVNIENKDQGIKVFALPLDKLDSKDEDFINRPRLIEGRLPEKSGEAVVEKGKILSNGLSIGDKIKIKSGTDKDIEESLKTNEFTIVGVVESPYYISYERGRTSIGNGKISAYIMIPQEDFNIPAYTDIFITSNNARKEASYSEEYKNIINPVKDKLEALGDERKEIRYEEIMAEAQKELSKAKKDLAEGEETQKKELKEAEDKLQDGRNKIAQGEKALKENRQRFKNIITDAENKLNQGYKDLQQGEKKYEEQYSAFLENKSRAEKEFAAAEKQIAEGESQLTSAQQKINDLKYILENNKSLTEAERQMLQQQIAAGEAAISKERAHIEASKKQLQGKKQELKAGGLKLQEAKRTLGASKVKLEQESEKLEASKKKAEDEFSAAERKIESSKAELKKGEEEYEKGKRESDEKLADARNKIADAEEDINSIEKPKWYVLDRNTNFGYVEYGNAADRMDAISKVFPVFFFLIAALVSLTTMTRMVDEQRIYIGTYKAMGYGKAAIASKYLIYALLASLTGGLVGVLIGVQVFPRVIFNAFRMMYILPEFVVEFDGPSVALAIAGSVLTTLAATWFACYKELMAAPALLMRPKAPKSGKRIFLERIKPLWSRLSFTHKVTARNIFRYKKRFIMTILGIGGCTALLLVGFGLKDSIVSITSKQFEEIFKYQLIIDLKDSINSGKNAEFINSLSQEHRITDHMFMREENIKMDAGGEEKSVSLMVPKDTKTLEDFISLRGRVNQDKLHLTDEGVILTEKLSKGLNVKIGDKVSIRGEEDERYEAEIIGITENYAGHYAYMTPVLYEKLYGKKPEFHKIMAKTSESSSDFENKLSEDLLTHQEVSSLSFTTEINRTFSDVTRSLNYVIIVLIVSAGALAFIVLYNLTNINVSERLREIATIKVLGFYDKEVSAYVYRENIILTMLGALVGLVLGIFLHQFIVVTSEVENLMFGREIKAMSYVYSFILTMIFAGIVNLVMYHKLKKIKMVESLKSVD
ncbi:ABC transporter permease [Clostridium polynesiense]|uniref:ABC transporter permease n=1 Tax=Clostridium polynesiense TaxID=1325933 RepID=UPI00058E9417|nr:ABC transporter permease [Clostridium polynesiense]